MLGDRTGQAAAKTLGDWTIQSNFILHFADVTAELRTQDGGVKDTKAIRPEGAEISVRVSCPELVTAVYRAAQQAEDVVGRIGHGQPWPRAPRRPGELARDHWVTSCLQLGMGQAKSAYQAAGAGMRILRPHGVDASDEAAVHAAGSKLSGQLRVAGRRELADRVDRLLSQLRDAE